MTAAAKAPEGVSVYGVGALAPVNNQEVAFRRRRVVASLMGLIAETQQPAT